MNDLIRPGLLAIRHYWKPFLLIDFCALLFVIGYFKSDAVHDWAQSFAAWKNRNGLPAVMLMGALSGAVLPELAKMLAMGDWKFDRRRLTTMGFHFVLFAGLAVMASVFYGLVADWLGRGGAGTVARKVIVDQLIYTPIIVLPTVIFAFTWRECGWSLRRAAARVGPAWYLRRVAPLLIPTWFFWVPMTSLMYSLSDDFIFCFAMIAQGAWCLLMAFVATEPATEDLAGEIEVAVT